MEHKHIIRLNLKVSRGKWTQKYENKTFIRLKIEFVVGIMDFDKQFQEDTKRDKRENGQK